MEKSHKVLALLFIISLIGCSKEREEYLESLARQATEVPFPHPEGWDQKDSHGLMAMQVGKEKCALCHGEDFSGGVCGVACASCHASYPHKTGWEAPTSHGRSLITASTTITTAVAACALCHGEDFQGGDTRVSCYACHSYPHPATGWETGGSSHGLYLQSRNFDVTLCAYCHGQGFTGGTSQVSCLTCHSTYPHPEPQWAQRGSGAFHGDTVISLGGPTGCGLCHGSDYYGGNSLLSCYSCHSLYPHSSDWASSTHMDYVTADGDGSCRGCHEDLRATLPLYPVSYPRCQFCH